MYLGEIDKLTLIGQFEAERREHQLAIRRHLRETAMEADRPETRLDRFLSALAQSTSGLRVRGVHLAKSRAY